MSIGPGAPPPLVLTKQVILTPAEIIAALATPASMIAGQPGKSIYLAAAYAEILFATTAYNTGITLLLTYASLGDLFMTLGSFMDRTSDTTAPFVFAPNVTWGDTKGLDLYMSGIGPAITQGDSPVAFSFIYGYL